MTRYASVVRDADGLQRLTQELEASDPRDLDCRASFEDVALTATARAVAAAALARTESRGCHHRSDFPDTDPALAQQPGTPAVGLLLMELSVDELTEARSHDRPRPRRGPALRPRRHHAGDGARRCDDDGRRW